MFVDAGAFELVVLRLMCVTAYAARNKGRGSGTAFGVVTEAPASLALFDEWERVEFDGAARSAEHVDWSFEESVRTRAVFV